MEKTIVLKPKKPAPVLKKWSELSFDAQCVLNAVQKQQSEDSFHQKGYRYFPTCKTLVCRVLGSCIN